ncbi:MAG: hypothetical protein AAGJ79_01470 [Verrucomicrobiota bacterium]
MKLRQTPLFAFVSAFLVAGIFVATVIPSEAARRPRGSGPVIILPSTPQPIVSNP